METAGLQVTIASAAFASLIWAAPLEARFLQVDPVGYDDQVNLYVYVGNDPINGVDPTGTTCTQVGEQRGGAPQYSCRIDFVSERRNGEWVRREPTEQENRRFAPFNRRYTEAVNRLARNPERPARVEALQGNRGSFRTTAGEAAASLVARTFIYMDTNTDRGAALVSFGLPNAQGRVEGAETLVMRNGLNASQRHIVHDGGMHSTPQEWTGGLLRERYPLGRIPHQEQYDSAACTLLGEENC